MKINYITDKILRGNIKERTKYFNSSIESEDYLWFLKEYYANENSFYELIEDHYNYYKVRIAVMNNIDVLLHGSKWEIGLGLWALIKSEKFSFPQNFKYIDILFKFINQDTEINSVISGELEYCNSSSYLKLEDLMSPKYLIRTYLCSRVNPLIIHDTLTTCYKLEGSATCGYNIITALYTTYFIDNKTYKLIFKFILDYIINNKRSFNSKVLSTLIEKSGIETNELLKMTKFAVDNKYIVEKEANIINKVILNGLM